MTLILNNILFYPYSRPVFISLIIYIKKLSVKYYTLISSHAKSLKPGVQVQFFFFGAYWLHFKCLTTSCGKGMPELPYRSKRRDVEISGKSTGQYLLASTGSGL